MKWCRVLSFKKKQGLFFRFISDTRVKKSFFQVPTERDISAFLLKDSVFIILYLRHQYFGPNDFVAGIRSMVVS